MARVKQVRRGKTHGNTIIQGSRSQHKMHDGAARMSTWLELPTTTHRTVGRPSCWAAKRYASGSGRPLYTSSPVITVWKVCSSPVAASAGRRRASGDEDTTPAGTCTRTSHCHHPTLRITCILPAGAPQRMLNLGLTCFYIIPSLKEPWYNNCPLHIPACYKKTRRPYRAHEAHQGLHDGHSITK
jgi:hypothetical protein